MCCSNEFRLEHANIVKHQTKQPWQKRKSKKARWKQYGFIKSKTRRKQDLNQIDPFCFVLFSFFSALLSVFVRLFPFFFSMVIVFSSFAFLEFFFHEFLELIFTFLGTWKKWQKTMKQARAHKKQKQKIRRKERNKRKQTSEQKATQKRRRGVFCGCSRRA